MPPSDSKSFLFPVPPGSLRILNNPNYLKYFAGQLVSMSGTWMQAVAQAWLVFRLTDSGYWLGIITFCGQLPAFLMAPYAGVIVDHADRRKILIIVQIIELVQALVLAALVFSGHVALWHIVVLAIVLGMVNAFDMTARHSFAIDMVGKADLSSAIALNSVTINISRVIGPVIAGVMLSALGEAWCFTLNGLSYLPVIWGLAAMKLAAHKPRQNTKSVLSNISEGWRYVGNNLVIFRILVLSSFICLIACPYNVLLPVFARKVLGGNANTLAWLSGSLGCGAVMAALLFSGVEDPQVIKRRLIADLIFWGLGLVMLGLSTNVWLSYGAMFTIGYFMMSVFPTMNYAIQHMVDDSMRGRVMSLYTMTFLGTMPLGSLAMGWLSDHYTAPVVVTGSGILTSVMGVVLVFRNAIRHQLKNVAGGVRG